VEQGILVERSRDTYSFSHLTFQEYLTAKFIVDNQKVDQLVRDHLTDQRWREVFLLAAGLAPGKQGADALLLAMEKAALRLLNTTGLKDLLIWADITTQHTPGDAKPSAKRTATLAFALVLSLALAPDLDLDLAFVRALDLTRARALALTLALDLDLTFVRALTLNFALDLASNPTSTRTRVLSRARNLARDYLRLGIFKVKKLTAIIRKLETLNPASFTCNPMMGIRIYDIDFNKNFLDLLKEEFDSLSNYLYSIELMVRCKEAAVRVSPSVWAGIESRILTVPSN
jgi:hypothetical protein